MKVGGWNRQVNKQINICSINRQTERQLVIIITAHYGVWGYPTKYYQLKQKAQEQKQQVPLFDYLNYLFPVQTSRFSSSLPASIRSILLERFFQYQTAISGEMQTTIITRVGTTILTAK